MKNNLREAKLGQSMVEYMLILSLVVIVVIIVLSQTGLTVTERYCEIVQNVDPQNNIACFGLIDGLGKPEDWKKIWGSGNWNLADQSLCMNNDIRLLNTAELPDNYKITVNNVKMDSGNGYALLFRLQASGYNHSGYSFQVDPGLGNKFAFRRYDYNGSELSKPLSIASFPAGFDIKAPHKIEVVVKGNQFTAFVDNNEVLTATDSTYPSGKMGLRSWDSSKVCFNDLNVIR